LSEIDFPVHIFHGDRDTSAPYYFAEYKFAEYKHR